MIITGALTCDPWLTVEDFCSSVDNTDVAGAESAIAAASDYLWRRTGCRYSGIKATTLRPVLCSCGGYWGYCGCTALKLSAPGDLPIVTIAEIRSDGNVVPSDQYVLLGENYLQPRGLYWPVYYQDMAVAPGDVGSWEIDITYGQPIPELGKLACKDLASELLKACNSDDDCVLPHGVVSITQDGTTYQFESITTGYTNIQTVDLFLAPQGGYVLQPWSGFGNPNSPTIFTET